MLYFVVALEPEAKPIVARYGLERDGEHDVFKVFRRADTLWGEVALVVSGPGKVAAAAAVTWLHLACGGARGGARQAAWLNVGIAGCRGLAVGEALLAHKVHERSSGLSWYPPQVFEPPLETGEVWTVDRVERDFAADAAYDMEASGFVATACRFSTSELVQCVKVVSDGPGDVPEKLSKGHVTELVEGHLDAVAVVADELVKLARELRSLEAEPPEVAELEERFYFTVTERRQLRRLVERWRVLCPGEPLPDLDGLGRGKAVVRRLRDVVDALPARLTDDRSGR